jgi:hypothetical protein
MKENRLLLLVATAVLTGAGVFAACSSSGGGGSVVLNARTGPAPAAASDGGLTPVELGNGIALDRVRIVIRRLEMELAGRPGGDGGAHEDGGTRLDGGKHEDDGVADEDGDDEGEDGEVVRGPFLIDLSGTPLAGGIHQAFDTQVPAGTYEEVCFVVNTLSQRMALQDRGLAAMQSLHASIAVHGTIDGKDFEFTAPFEVRQCRRGNVTVGGGTTDLTFDVDYRGWFTGRGGERLDPGAPTDRGEILANIRCSIRIFPDRDKDGHPDDGDEGHEDEWHRGCPPGPKPPHPDGGTPDGGLPDGGIPG